MSWILGFSENSCAPLAIQKSSVPTVTGIIAPLSHIQSQNIPFTILNEVLKLTARPPIDETMQTTAPVEESDVPIDR